MAAFIDRIDVSVDANASARRHPYGQAFINWHHRPIRREAGIYSQVADGESRYSGNPVALSYGKFGRAAGNSRVPPFQIVMRSESAPLTGSEVLEIKSAFFADRARAWISSAETTFGLAHSSVAFFQQHILAAKRKWRRFGDPVGGRTIYFGTRHSDWQLAVYDKTSEVTRTEIRLRREYLKRNDLQNVESLIRLRTIPLATFFQLRAVRLERVAAVLDQAKTLPGPRHVLMKWTRQLPELERARILCRQFRCGPDYFYSTLPLQGDLSRMLERLVW